MDDIPLEDLSLATPPRAEEVLEEVEDRTYSGAATAPQPTATTYGEFDEKPENFDDPVKTDNTSSKEEVKKQVGNNDEAKKVEKKGSGWFSGILNIFTPQDDGYTKANLPDGNQFVYDSVKKKWVMQGAEEEEEEEEELPPSDAMLGSAPSLPAVDALDASGPSALVSASAPALSSVSQDAPVKEDIIDKDSSDTVGEASGTPAPSITPSTAFSDPKAAILAPSAPPVTPAQMAFGPDNFSFPAPAATVSKKPPKRRARGYVDTFND